MTNKIYYGFDETPVLKEYIMLELPQGWKTLIYQLIDDLFAEGWDGQLNQVKEKFGSLRFYVGQSSDAIDKLINDAEVKSGKICIYCGEPKIITTDGWITNLCGIHRGVQL